jgi:hypothetical protein
LGILGAIICATLYFSNPNNPSNTIFLTFTYIVFCVVATAGGFIAKATTVHLSANSFNGYSAVYLVFVVLFNMFIFCAAIGLLASEALPDSKQAQWLLQSGFGENLSTIIKLSLFVEIALDFGYYIAAEAFEELLYVGIFIIELVLFFIAILSFVSVGLYDTSLLAGILATGHVFAFLFPTE